MRTLLILIIAITTFNLSYAQDEIDITTIILVRHAEKITDGSKNPDLTSEGEERAIRLSEKFNKAGITAIYSSPYTRTIKTVTPLSKSLNIDIQEYNPSDKQFINNIYEENIGKTIIVSGHSNTTPMAINTLLGENKYEEIDHEQYGRIFIVTIANETAQRVMEIQY